MTLVSHVLTFGADASSRIHGVPHSIPLPAMQATAPMIVSRSVVSPVRQRKSFLVYSFMACIDSEMNKTHAKYSE